MTFFKPLGLAAALAIVSLSAAAHAPQRADVVRGAADVQRHAWAPAARDAGRRVATPRIDARQSRQQARIRHGIASGRLTAPEAARLQATQRRIARIEARSKADGVVSPAERQRLMRLLDRASAQIRHEKHDWQTAGW